MRRARAASRVERGQLRRLLAVDRPPEREVVRRTSSTAARASSIHVRTLTPTVMCSESELGRERLVEPAARQVERVAGLQRDVEDRLAGRAERRAVALVLQRQLEHRLVDEPALLARDLEREHLVRVVVDGQPLRAAGRVIGVRLRGVAEERLQVAAVARERRARGDAGPGGRSSRRPRTRRGRGGRRRRR